MKKWLLLTAVAGVLPFTLYAQDDMYFTPSKTKEKSKVVTVEQEQPTYYSGINQDVDEYNRRRLHSSYQFVGTDSLGNDVIDFTQGSGYPKDTVYVLQDDDDDFAYSRRMGRFDGFYGWYDPYFYGYWGGPWRSSYWGWYDPWYWGYYDPWYYSSWYGYYGWGWPYRYRYYDYAWYPTYRYGGGRHGRPVTGTRNHGSVARGVPGSSHGTFGSRGSGARNSGSRAYGSRSGSGSYSPQGSFSGGSRSSSGTSRRSSGSSFGSSSRSSGSGSFGSRGGGSSFGGGSRGGGGSFGGGSRGGGGSFGGGSRGHR